MDEKLANSYSFSVVRDSLTNRNVKCQNSE